MTHTAEKPIIIVSGCVAVDFETLYTKDYSLKHMGPHAYCHHELFDAYLAAIFGYDLNGVEVSYVGHPKFAPWRRIINLAWLSHNRGFDKAVYVRLNEDDPFTYPEHTAEWHCTANLGVYLGAPRNLGGAALHLLGRRMDKTIRDTTMKGKRWSEFDTTTQDAISTYALGDSINCYLLWAYYGDQWPESERKLSEATYRMGERGIAVNIGAIETGIKSLSTAMHHSELLIPWRHEHPLLSPKQFAAECRKIGLMPPLSLAMDDEDTELWFDKFGDRAPFAQAMRSWRRANALKKKLMAMLSRVMENGRMAYSLLYGGAHTMRWSGSGGFNMQNLPRASQFLLKSGMLEMGGALHKAIAKRLAKGETVDELEHEINLRSSLVASEGCKFGVFDYSQIEARITPWIAGDWETLALCEKGMSVYEVHARRFMGWVGGVLKKEDAGLYLLAKARVLALGFGAGHKKFLFMASLYIDDPVMYDQIFGAPVEPHTVDAYIQSQTWMFKVQQRKVIVDNKSETVAAAEKRAEQKRQEWLTEWSNLPEQERRYLVNSWLQVESFRESNEKITNVWKVLDTKFKSACERGDRLFTTTLPSGRKLRYFDMRIHEKGGCVARTEMGGPEHFFYGGKLFENCVSGGAEVLTDTRGWVPLYSVTKVDRLWDGHSFVGHDGLVNKGAQRVINLAGVYATPDHKFLSASGWISAESACANKHTVLKYKTNDQTNTDNETVEMGESSRETLRNHNSYETAGLSQQGHLVGTPMRLRRNRNEESEGRAENETLLACVPTRDAAVVRKDENTRYVQTPSIWGVARYETAVRGREPSGVSQLRRPRYNGLRRVGKLVRDLLGRYGAYVGAWVGLGQNKQRGWLLEDELRVGDARVKLSEQTGQQGSGVGVGRSEAKRDKTFNAILPSSARGATRNSVLGDPRLIENVYDVLNCGPSHQFAVRAPGASEYLIAHNCVQAIARDIIAEAIVRIEAAGITIVLHVHDEIVAEVLKDFDSKIIADLMRVRPSWAQTLPIDVEFKDTYEYEK